MKPNSISRQQQRDGTLIRHSGCGSQVKEWFELATLERVYWFNLDKLLELTGYIPPAEAVQNYYRQFACQLAIPI